MVGDNLLVSAGMSCQTRQARKFGPIRGSRSQKNSRKGLQPRLSHFESSKIHVHPNSLKLHHVCSLLRVRLVVAAEDTFENAWTDILTCACSLHAVFKGAVRLSEGVESNLDLVGSAGNVVVWTIRILNGETIVLLYSAINAVLSLETVSWSPVIASAEGTRS
jgi:hypothetical protein